MTVFEGEFIIKSERENTGSQYSVKCTARVMSDEHIEKVHRLRSGKRLGGLAYISALA